MNKLVQVSNGRDIIRAIGADEQANTNYYQVLRRFISNKSTFPEDKLCQPDDRLNDIGLNGIDIAWLKLQNTEKNLRKTCMKLYVASL